MDIEFMRMVLNEGGRFTFITTDRSLTSCRVELRGLDILASGDTLELALGAAKRGVVRELARWRDNYNRLIDSIE